jgi:hypothetical protein
VSQVLEAAHDAPDEKTAAVLYQGAQNCLDMTQDDPYSMRDLAYIGVFVMDNLNPERRNLEPQESLLETFLYNKNIAEKNRHKDEEAVLLGPVKKARRRFVEAAKTMSNAPAGNVARAERMVNQLDHVLIN